MKYEIDGIEKGKTIKSVQIVDTTKPVLYLGSNTNNKVKVIMVDYLDGTQDIFEFNEEALKRIQNMVDTQAKTFVDQNDNVETWFKINIMIAVLSLFVFIITTFVEVSMMSVIVSFGKVGIMSAIVSALTAGNAVRLNAKNKNIKKHKIYVDKIMGKLEEYNEILKKENGLSKEPNKELVNIINIDKKSVKELEYIGNKIERYNEIEGKSPKKKTL